MADRTRIGALAGAGLVAGVLLAGCASSRVGYEGDRDAPAAETYDAGAGSLKQDPPEGVTAPRPDEPAIATTAAEHYGRTRATVPRHGPLLLDLGERLRSPDGSGTVGAPILAYALENARLYPFDERERRVLADAIGDSQSVLLPDDDLTAPGVASEALVAEARRRGAPAVCLVRFSGEGRDRNVAVVLIDTESGSTIAVAHDLEPSLEMVGARVRDYLP